jgi:hypothetical protein
MEAGLSRTSPSGEIYSASGVSQSNDGGGGLGAHTVQVQEVGSHQHLETVFHRNIHVWHIILISELVPILEILDKFLKDNAAGNLLTWIILGTELNAEDMS